MKIIYLLNFLALTSLSVSAGAVSNSKFKIIVNSKQPLSSIKESTIKDIFLGNQTRWENGNPIKIYFYNYDSKNQKDFCSSFLGRSSYQIKKYYLMKSFSGDIPALPVEVEDSDQMVRFISENPDSIAYLPENAPIPQGSKVKVLLVK